MDYYEFLLKRRSCRAYKAESPDVETVMKVVDAGRMAPSGMNTQLWHFTAVMNREKIREISEYVLGNGSSICYDAPVFIMVSYDRTNSFAKEDCACALTNMMQAASALGLGSDWINAVNKREDKAVSMQAFGVPEGYRVYGCLALGYSAMEYKERVLKERSETVTIIR